MTWRDNYSPASFRGASFFVEDADSTHGRRQAVHEHAQRDVPYTEDLGRKAREFSITGYLIGDNYNLDREAIISACEQIGPGLLVHPYRGELFVVCRGLTVKESSSEGRMCRLTMTFLEAGRDDFPSVSVDSVNAIASAADALKATARASFVERFLTSGFPGQVLDAAQGGLTQVADFIAEPGFNFAAEIGAASDLFYEARNMAADAFDLVQAPISMADRMFSTISNIRGGFGFSSFGVLSSMVARFSGSSAGSASTLSRQRISINQNATNDYTRQLAIAEASKEAIVRLSTFMPATAQLPGSSESVFGAYPSVQDVLRVRDQLTGIIDAELENERTSDEVFVTLMALRAQVVRGLPLPGASLPQLAEVTPVATVPALVLAHNLYGDASRAEEIVARNRPRHPGFLTGGSPLEVLSDG
jgi:prophage DNA circulation protein